jgi:hypothetical protein
MNIKKEVASFSFYVKAAILEFKMAANENHVFFNISATK